MGETDWYEVFKQAETGSTKDPWIRTTGVPKESSSAFGPVQITYSKAKDYVKRGLVSPESAQFFKAIMEPMYQNFLKYGREKGKSGYTPAYDYGGTGNFDATKYGIMYQRMAEEMLANDANASKGDIMKLIKSWRGKTSDTRYNAAIMKAMQEYNNAIQK